MLEHKALYANIPKTINKKMIFTSVIYKTIHMWKYIFSVLLLIFILERYTYIALLRIDKKGPLYFYVVISILAISYIAYQSLRFSSTHRNPFGELMVVILFFFLPKLFLILPLILEDIFRVNAYLINNKTDTFPERKKFISLLALGLTLLPFAGLLHGVIWGKYRFRVMRKTIYFKDLPEAFDGLTITQLSDIHSGSFDNEEKVLHGIEMANQQKSDLILFTGDLVNNRADEMSRWQKLFKNLRAPLGVFSSLGNHDYGDYISWPNAQAKKKNLEKLCEIHKNMGWRLLRNEHHIIERNKQQIAIMGVENWGLPPFPQYGDLEKAGKGLDKEIFKVLLSHDPSHFDAQTKKFPKKIHLSLAGHTHGMQFGIEIPGWIKWSPVKYRYPKWAGLYEENDRYLYVNRGFGYLAFPGRVGIWPEITVLTLKRKLSV